MKKAQHRVRSHLSNFEAMAIESGSGMKTPEHMSLTASLLEIRNRIDLLHARLVSMHDAFEDNCSDKKDEAPSALSIVQTPTQILRKIEYIENIVNSISLKLFGQ